MKPTDAKEAPVRTFWEWAEIIVGLYCLGLIIAWLCGVQL
jgi:hypothetical protein